MERIEATQWVTSVTFGNRFYINGVLPYQGVKVCYSDGHVFDLQVPLLDPQDTVLALANLDLLDLPIIQSYYREEIEKATQLLSI